MYEDEKLTEMPADANDAHSLMTQRLNSEQKKKVKDLFERIKGIADKELHKLEVSVRAKQNKRVSDILQAIRSLETGDNAAVKYDDVMLMLRDAETDLNAIPHSSRAIADDSRLMLSTSAYVQESISCIEEGNPFEKLDVSVLWKNIKEFTRKAMIPEKVKLNRNPLLKLDTSNPLSDANSDEEDDDELPSNAQLSFFGRFCNIGVYCANFDFCRPLISDSYVTPTNFKAKKVKKQVANAANQKTPVFHLEEKTKNDSIDGNESISKLIEHVYDSLTKLQVKQIPYYEFVLDKNSFGRTIENMFHLSFLIRDCRVCVKFEHDQLKLEPLDSETQKSMQEGLKNGVVECFQSISAFSYTNWKDLCEIFPGDPLIKPYMTKSESMRKRHHS